MQATLYLALVDLLWGIRRGAPIGEMDRSQLHVLALLTRQPGLRTTEVSRIVGLDLSTISRHCSDLVAQGLITRQEDPQDRRATRLDATPAGHAMVDEIAQRQQQVLDTALATWNDTDRDMLIRLINRLGNDLNALGMRTEMENAS